MNFITEQVILVLDGKALFLKGQGRISLRNTISIIEIRILSKLTITARYWQLL